MMFINLYYYQFRTTVKFTLRLHRILVRWGFLKHPLGREYAKKHIGLLGGYKRVSGSG